MAELTQPHLSVLIAIITALVVTLGVLVPPARRASRVPLVLLAVLATLAWPNWARIQSRNGIVHGHEQVHFLLGSRYLPELGYHGLYPAIVAARLNKDRNLPRAEIRDTRTFQVHKVSDRLEEAEAAKARFSAERWEAFSADLEVYRRELRAPLERIISDHGMTGSPSWALFALLFTAWPTVSTQSANLLGLIDPALFLILLVSVARAFGARAVAVTAVLAFTPGRVFDFLGGSILRMDWLFFLGMALCALQVRRFRAGGLLLGLAIASKVFCALIPLMLGAHMLRRWVSERAIPLEHRQVIGFAFLGLLGAVAASSLAFGGPGIWVEYIERILLTLHEGYYRAQYGFRDVYIQVAVNGPAALFDPFPGRIHARHADLASFGTGLNLARLALLALLAWVSSRQAPLLAAGLGVLGIYLGLVTNMYYWSLFLVLGLGLASSEQRRHGLALGLLCGLVALLRGLEVTDWESLHARSYLGSWLLLWSVILLAGVELGLSLLAWRRARAI